jgi:hypothetical protein
MSFGIIDNVFDQMSVQEILDICHEFNNTTGYFLRRKDPLCSRLMQIVMPAINRIENGDHYYKSMFLDIDTPGGAHVDEYYDRSARNTYIFPLYLQYKDSTRSGYTSTLVFNECYYSDYQPTDDRYDIRPFFQTAPDQIDGCHQMSQQLIGAMFHNREESYNNLKKLSIAAVLPWRIGSMLYFQRNQIHGSSNIVMTNVSKKQALVVFTTNDPIGDELW